MVETWEVFELRDDEQLISCLLVLGFYMYLSYVAGMEERVSLCYQSKCWKQAIIFTDLLHKTQVNF